MLAHTPLPVANILDCSTLLLEHIALLIVILFFKYDSSAEETLLAAGRRSSTVTEVSRRGVSLGGNCRPMRLIAAVV